MERLTEHERTALVEIGPPGEGPIPPYVFDKLQARGWGYWDNTGWCVTAAGRKALEFDDLARRLA